MRRRSNSLGATPIKAHLAEIDALKNTTELAELIGRFSMIAIGGPVDGYIEADAGDPTRVAVYLSQSGTALPDRDYYLNSDARFVEIRTKYQEYLEKVFTLAGRPNPEASAKLVVALETDLARSQWTRVESRDAVKTFNKYPVAKLVQEMPGFDWVDGRGRSSSTNRPNGSSGSRRSSRASRLSCPSGRSTHGRRGLRRRSSPDTRPLLNQPFQDAAFDFFGRTLSGQQEQRLRWKRGVQFVNGVDWRRTRASCTWRATFRQRRRRGWKR